MQYLNNMLTTDARIMQENEREVQDIFSEQSRLSQRMNASLTINSVPVSVDNQLDERRCWETFHSKT